MVCFYFMCVNSCVYVYACLVAPEVRNGGKGSCKLPCRCQEPCLGPLQEQQVFLTTKSSSACSLLFQKLSLIKSQVSVLFAFAC